MFIDAFKDELVKLASIKPEVLSWAFSRGLTSGMSAAAMGLGLMAATTNKDDEGRKGNLVRAALIPATIGTFFGLGKGLAEKGLENKILKLFNRGR